MERTGTDTNILDDMKVDIVRILIGTESMKIVVGDKGLEAMKEDDLTRGVMIEIHVGTMTMIGETIAEEQTITGKETVLRLAVLQVPTLLRIDV